MSFIEDQKQLEAEHADHAEGGFYDESGKLADVADTEAAAYIDPTVVISPDENKRLRRKVYMRVLPLLCAGYVTQSLDKGTLGSASIMGWQANVGAVGQDYALTTTLLYIGIILGEPISNQLIRRFPVGKMLGSAMLVWTALLLGLAFSLSIPAVFVLRILLGFFEAFFHPCLVAVTVQWFLKNEQVLLITVWQSMFALSNLIAAVLAYGFYQIHGATGQRANGLYPWQWMSICIAFLSLAAALSVFFFLPDSPAKAPWATDDEKVKFIERVRANDQGIKQPVFRKEQAVEAVRDVVPWLLFLMIGLQTLVVGGINTFNSLLINQAFGFTVSQSQLLGIPLAFFQAFLFYLIGWLATVTNQTILCMIGYTFINITGTIVLLTVTPGATTKGGLLVAFYLMQAFQATAPSMWSLLARNVAGQSKKSIAYAMFFIASAAGNVIGPQFFQSKWAPRYINSLYIHLGVYVAFILTLLVLRTVLVKRNRSRDAAMQQKHQENHHAHAFEDLTDLQNPEFRYSY